MTDVFAHVLAAYPRFHGAIGPASDLGEFSVPAVNLSHFPLGSRRAEGELWFYSFLGSVLGPWAVAAVEFEQVPSLALDDATLRLHSDQYWVNWQPASSASTSGPDIVRAAGADFAAYLAGIIPELCAYADCRPAPLWALARDAVVSSCLEAGNIAWDPELGISTARWLAEGFGFSDFPVEVIGGGPLESGESVVVSPRQSCCQIYRLAGAEPCTSCPRRSSASRAAGLKAYAASVR
ncbi:(2Fe-2S)-binding protein [Staphylococcus chromogenes]|nr:(2Fe-2S)-binding protein [Staphylococcus chromogenes]